jgi:hypothetical protein
MDDRRWQTTTAGYFFFPWLCSMAGLVVFGAVASEWEILIVAATLCSTSLLAWARWRIRRRAS